MRKVFLLAGAGGLLFFGAFQAVYLQEFASDKIPEAARAAGVSLPLKDPHLEVRLQQMRMTLWEGDTVVKHYDIGFGAQTPGRVVDRVGSTPLGEFVILKKHFREEVFDRGSRFLEFAFPTIEVAEGALDQDYIARDQFERIVAANNIGDQVPNDTPLGGPIGIQGNFFPMRNRRFTDGSIALSNGDLNELFEYIPVGTVVEIKN